MAELLVDNPNWQAFANGLEQDRGLTPGLLSGILRNETAGGHPDIITKTSKDGAQGAFQFMPDTAKQYNVDVADTADSTRGAADYLGTLQKRYGDPLLAGAAYNWGEGHLDKAIAAAKGAGIPTDALSLANHGFLPKETAGYVVKLNASLAPAAAGPTQFSPEVVNSTRQSVIQMTAQGQSPAAIVQALSKSPVASMIGSLTAQGTSPTDIVSQIGGQQLADFKSKTDGAGVATNLVGGAGDAVSDLKAGAQQIGARISGNDDRLRTLQQEQIAREADPERIARGNTISGQLGSVGVKAVPAVVATALTGGTDLIPMALAGAAAGATSGALKPTTADGQFASNVFTEGGLGGLGGVGGALLGKGLGAASSVVSNPERAAATQALMADAKAQGLPTRLMDVNPTMKSLAAGLGENSTIATSNASVDAALAKKIGEGLGLQNYAGPIDHEMLQAAKPAIQANLDNATNVSVTLPQSLKAELAPLANGSTNKLTEGIATNSTVKQAVGNLIKAVDDGAPIAGKSLQELNSELKALAVNQAASATERQMASHLVGRINTALTDAMTPEQAAAFNAANKQWANLKTVERMVSASNDTGVVTPRQILQASKTGRTRTQFLNGEAPFQDLGGTAADLYGPSSSNGLANVIGSALEGHGSPLGTALAITHPHVGLPALAVNALGKQLMAKLATSENPTLLRLASGGAKGLDPTIANYIAKALGSSGAGAASATG